MGQLVFQATLGGQVNLVGPNTASTLNINVPAFAGTMASMASVTTNGVNYVNSSGQPTSGSSFVFDGTNVGIGTASPAAKLDVIGIGRINEDGSGTKVLQLRSNYSSLGPAIQVTTNDPLLFLTNNSERMRIDSSGNVGIGTTSPTSKLSVANGSSGGFEVNPDGTGSGPALIAYNRNTSAYLQMTSTALFHVWQTSGTERMRIDSSGNLLVGTTNASGSAGLGFKVIANNLGAIPASVTDQTTNGSHTTYNYYSTGAGAFRFYVGAGGTIFATSIVISAISDQRLKENVRDIDAGLNSIMALKPRRFDWKEGKGQDKKNVAGFIAQEFEDVFPECVSTSMAGADGIEYKNINHETLIPTLVKAIQEQQALITTLTDRITALEAK